MVGQFGKMKLNDKGDLKNLNRNPKQVMSQMAKAIDPKLLQQMGGMGNLMNMMKEMGNMEGMQDMMQQMMGGGGMPKMGGLPGMGAGGMPPGMPPGMMKRGGGRRR